MFTDTKREPQFELNDDSLLVFILEKNVNNSGGLTLCNYISTAEYYFLKASQVSVQSSQLLYFFPNTCHKYAGLC